MSQNRQPVQRTSTIDLLMVATVSHIPFVWVVLASIAQHTNAPLRVFVLSDHVIPPRHTDTFADSLPQISIHWIHLSDLEITLADVPDPQFDVHRISYARLLGPNLVSADCMRLIYLDTDVLVRKDIRHLWNVDLEGHPIAAARDFGCPWIGFPTLGLAFYREAAIDPAGHYFNSGVLVIDVERWRADHLQERSIALLKSMTPIRYADQDALNAVLHDDWKSLDPKWNVFPVPPAETFANLLLGPDEAEAMASDPAIVHFAGREKPWNADQYPQKVPGYADEWISVIARGPYAHESSTVRMFQRLATRFKTFKALTYLWHLSLSQLRRDIMSAVRR